MNEKGSEFFYKYYERWIRIYKEGAIRDVTMKKYEITLVWLKKLVPQLSLCDLNRITYQKLLNDYAAVHERQTTMDFHHQLKAAILDAVDDGMIERDPTRKAIIKGKTPRAKKIKYLNQFELHTLLSSLKLPPQINWDWLILLIAKTGMRFSEALALTPKDFDFARQSLSVIRGRVFNSTVNSILARHCKAQNIPVISIHGLRHTHASLLLFAGVSIASVARRLGHASMTTTQKTYLHIIQELENRDIDLVMRSLSGLT